MKVSSEVKDLFEYITRYKPQKIDLETKLKPFVPDYIPAVGEVDACLKMTKPDGLKEDLGINQLDEPALNCEDKTVLELKYVQSKNVVRSAPMTVDSIEGADKDGPKSLACRAIPPENRCRLSQETLAWASFLTAPTDTA